MPWVKGIVSGRIEDDGRIIAMTRDIEVVQTDKPRTFEESGSDAAVFDRLQRRVAGAFETVAHFGGATAVLVRSDALALLSDPLMAKLVQKYGLWDDTTFIAPVRTTSGGGRWNDAEPCGGMFEGEKDGWPFEWLEETCELGVFREDGWLRFILPEELRSFQEAFDRRQSFWWSVVRPGFSCRHEAPIRFLPIGRDHFDGIHGIITAGPVGDFAITRIAQLYLEGTGWHFLDTESRPGNRDKGEPEWVPLHRKVVAIVPREGKAPLMLELHPEGHLHPGGLHLAIDGENKELVVTHIGKAVLEALGWFR